ncbi:MAG TPA: hypothetical protein PLT66_05730 [Bacillota bacterium]|nr:hypothetical protein [Bacillota bacterium]
MEMVISMCCALFSAVVCPIAVFFIEQKYSRSEKLHLSNIEEQKREALLTMKLTRAGNELSYAIAIALKRGKANGEVERAIASYNEAEAEYSDYLRENAVEHLLEKQ